MRRIVVFTACLVLCLATLAENTNTLLMYYRSAKPLTLIEIEKAKDITNGITFKQIIDDLGPGWRSPSEGIGLACWTFKDGRQLNVKLPNYTMVEGRAIKTPLLTAHYFWLTNVQTVAMTNTTTQQQPKYIRY